jgi:hypothetical protein
MLLGKTFADCGELPRPLRWKNITDCEVFLFRNVCLSQISKIPKVYGPTNLQPKMPEIFYFQLILDLAV